jgi:mannose-6-phosphate isomerase-like protein (cupin superfamily)
MSDLEHSSPVLPFAAAENREYGFIHLFDPVDELPRSLPFRYSKFTVAPGKTSRPDQHEVLETWVILSGEGRLFYDGRTLLVKVGDVVRFESQHVHRITNDGGADLTVFSFWWTRDRQPL